MYPNTRASKLPQNIKGYHTYNQKNLGTATFFFTKQTLSFPALKAKLDELQFTANQIILRCGIIFLYMITKLFCFGDRNKLGLRRKLINYLHIPLPEKTTSLFTVSRSV